MLDRAFTIKTPFTLKDMGCNIMHYNFYSHNLAFNLNAFHLIWM